MASYGRNFDFRIPPRAAARAGRYVAPLSLLSGSGAGGGTAAGSACGAGLIPIGAPVVADLDAGQDAVGRQIVKLAVAGDGPSASPNIEGMCGILVYEYGPAAYAGHDPYTTTYSDLDSAPVGAAVQVISGDPAAKVVFTNTVANSFLGIRSYPGRVMVNGFGASPDVVVGDFLTPGAGDDVDGYWQSTDTAADAWLVITSIDTTRLEVEARMLF